MALLYPTYKDLIAKVNENAGFGEEDKIRSRYPIVIAAAKRARQLVKEQENCDIDAAEKPLSEAVSELYSGEVKIKKM